MLEREVRLVFVFGAHEDIVLNLKFNVGVEGLARNPEEQIQCLVMFVQTFLSRIPDKWFIFMSLAMLKLVITGREVVKHKLGSVLNFVDSLPSDRAFLSV